MGRMVIGGAAAGFVMFVLGWVFFGSPLMSMLGVAPASDDMPAVATLVSGYIQLSASAIALAMLLSLVNAGARMQVVIWSSITAMVFTHLGDPIWEGASWSLAIYQAVAGFIMLVAAGYVLTRWFAPAATTVAAE